MGNNDLSFKIADWFQTYRDGKSNLARVIQQRLEFGTSPLICFYPSALAGFSILTEEEAHAQLLSNLESLDFVPNARNSTLDSILRDLSKRTAKFTPDQKDLSPDYHLLLYLGDCIQKAKSNTKIRGHVLANNYRRNLIEMTTTPGVPHASVGDPETMVYVQVKTFTHTRVVSPPNMSGPIYALFLEDYVNGNVDRLQPYVALYDLSDTSTIAHQFTQSPPSVDYRIQKVSSYRPILIRKDRTNIVACSENGIVGFGVGSVSLEKDMILEYKEFSLGTDRVQKEVPFSLLPLLRNRQTATGFPVVYAFDTLGRGCTLSLR